MAASLLQVPVKHLQHFVTLAAWPQTQPKELFHLQILGSPLYTPAVALQGRLALLCGHPMHHGLQHLNLICRSSSLEPIPRAAP